MSATVEAQRALRELHIRQGRQVSSPRSNWIGKIMNYEYYHYCGRFRLPGVSIQRGIRRAADDHLRRADTSEVVFSGDAGPPAVTTVVGGTVGGRESGRAEAERPAHRSTTHRTLQSHTSADDRPHLAKRSYITSSVFSKKLGASGAIIGRPICQL